MIRKILPWLAVTGISTVMAFGVISSALADRKDSYAVRHHLDSHWRNSHRWSQRSHHGNGNSNSAWSRQHARTYTSYNSHTNNGNHYGQYKNHTNNGNHNGQYKNHENNGNH